MTPLAGAGALLTYTPTVYNPGTINTINQIGNAFNNNLQTQTAGGFWEATTEQRAAMGLQDDNTMSDGNSIDIEVTFTTPQIVTMYRIWARPDFKHNAPRRWKLKGIINTNGDFDVLDYQGWVARESYPDTVNNTLPSDNPHTALEFSFNNTTPYLKYVFSIIDTNRGTNPDDPRDYCSIGELGLYGT